MAKTTGKKKIQGRRKATGRRWSRRVMETSNALDLDRGVFKRSAPEIAKSLKRSAARRSKDRSKARSDYQAAMSMLNFYVNRAGRSLPARERRRLQRAKGELRKLYGRD